MLLNLEIGRRLLPLPHLLDSPEPWTSPEPCSLREVVAVRTGSARSGLRGAAECSSAAVMAPAQASVLQAGFSSTLSCSLLPPSRRWEGGAAALQGTVCHSHCLILQQNRQMKHISAEQKRRFNIKMGFDTLNSLISNNSKLVSGVRWAGSPCIGLRTGWTGRVAAVL